MTHADSPAGAGRTITEESVIETQLLQRKVRFYRRLIWLVLGTGAVVLFVVWSRGETRRRECRESLQYYAARAREADLARENPNILEKQWAQLDPAPTGFSPVHYDLVVKNWSAVPFAGESLPLAVCRDPHISTFSRGRHVLVSEPTGYHVRWWPEARARPVVREARKDNILE